MMLCISRLLPRTPLFGRFAPHMLHRGARPGFLFRFHSGISNNLPGVAFKVNSAGGNMIPKLSEVGEKATVEYRGFFVDEKGDRVSPWHDLPYKCGETGLYYMVVEIPRHTTAKMEIATQLEHNPIKQDLMKDGSLRYLDCPYYWNYGAIPQTWEEPVEHSKEDPLLGGLTLVGDNDPVDAVDVSQTTLECGAVAKVKVVGGLGLVDEGEIDWKIFVVREDDPHFDKINDLDDIDVYYPGTTTGVREFCRWYKTPKGKPLNKFLPEKNFISRAEAVDVLEATHQAYLKLRAGQADKGKLWLPDA